MTVGPTQFPQPKQTHRSVISNSQLKQTDLFMQLTSVSMGKINILEACMHAAPATALESKNLSYRTELRQAALTSQQPPAPRALGVSACCKIGWSL
jgi:hypothetical protein